MSKSRVEILYKELFKKNVPYFSRDVWFAFAWDRAGRQVVLACESKKEAKRKQELLYEYLELIDETPLIDFEPDFTA